MGIKDRFYDVPVVGVALRMQDRYADDDAGQYAAAIGFYAFLSFFAILLGAVTVAGFVLADDPAAQQRLVDGIQDAVPGLSAALGAGQGGVGGALQAIIDNRGGLSVASLVSVLLAGLGVVNAAMVATNRVFHVDRHDGGVVLKLRQLGALLLLGAVALLGVSASSALGVAVSVDVSSATAVVGSVTAVAVSLALDVGLFLLAYRTLATGSGPSFRRLWPGALLAGAGWTVLKAAGAAFVGAQAEKYDQLYGALGGVFALLVLFNLAARLYLYGAELSAVLYAPGADMARRSDGVVYEGEDPSVLPYGPVRAAPGVEPDLAPARPHAPPDEAAGPVPEWQRPHGRRPDAETGAPSSEATRDALAARDRERAGASRDGVARSAFGFLLGVGVLGAVLRVLRPWGDD